MVRALVLITFGFLMAAQALATGADFTLMGIDGRSHRLSDFRGKWVVVNYWASWCPPCVEEMPDLASFHDKHKDKDAVVIGVNMDEAVSADDVASFAEQLLVSYPVLLSEPDMTVLGPIEGLPTTFLVSPEGEVVAQKLGMIDAEGIESLIRDNSKKESVAADDSGENDEGWDVKRLLVFFALAASIAFFAALHKKKWWR